MLKIQWFPLKRGKELPVGITDFMPKEGHPTAYTFGLVHFARHEIWKTDADIKKAVDRTMKSIKEYRIRKGKNNYKT